jgi:LysR family carnitine catabolism transcriptional activator
MIHLQGLRTLVTIVDAGGVRPASKRLGRTPSAVSMALKQLESSIGAPLFQEERKVRLTELGQITIENARELLRHYDSTCATIHAFARNEVSRCNVASVTSIAAAILPPAILKVKQTSKHFEVTLREVHSANLGDIVAEGRVDIGFGRLGPSRSDLVAIELFKDRYDLVCPSHHPLAHSQKPIEWSALAKCDFIVNESFGGVLPPELVHVIEKSRFHGSSTTSTFSMVLSEIGVTILPRLCKGQAPTGLTFVPLADKKAYRRVGMITKKGRRLTPAIELLYSTVKEVLAEKSAILGYELAK